MLDEFKMTSRNFITFSLNFRRLVIVRRFWIFDHFEQKICWGWCRIRNGKLILTGSDACWLVIFSQGLFTLPSHYVT